MSPRWRGHGTGVQRLELARQPVPQRVGEHRDIGGADAKRQRRLLRRLPPQRGIGNGLAASRQRQHGRARAMRTRGARRAQRCQIRRHVAAVTHACLHIALGTQTLQRPQHGVAAHTQRARMLARGRQACAWREAALLDGGAQLAVDAQPQRRGWRRCGIGPAWHDEMVPPMLRSSLKLWSQSRCIRR